ncbi:MAG: response regulator [Myxococcota bacterium]
MIINKKIEEAPCCSHPFSVYLVDDNFNYLLDTLGSLDNKLFRYQMSQWPEKLWSTLNKQYGDEPFIHRNVQQVPISGSGYQHIDVLTSHIHLEVKRLARFEQVGILLLDVEMPALNGLKMCDRLTNPYMQKIALTGKLSKDDAITALSEGRVHQVIHKEDSNLEERLHKALHRAYWKYYKALTKGLYGSHSPYTEGSAPRDAGFFQLLQQQMQQYNAVEHYVCDAKGTFLLVDKEGKTHLLFARTAQQLQQDLQAPQAKSADSSLLQQLRQNKKMLCYFHPENAELPPGSQWQQHIQPLQIHQGDQPLFYACVPNAMPVEGLTPFCTYEQPADAMGKSMASKSSPK